MNKKAKKKEKLLIRCLLAKAVKSPPDDVEIILDSNNIEEVLFQVKYHDYILVIGGFERLPGVQELRDHIEYLYQTVVEWEKDNPEGDQIN